MKTIQLLTCNRQSQCCMSNNMASPNIVISHRFDLFMNILVCPASSVNCNVVYFVNIDLIDSYYIKSWTVSVRSPMQENLSWTKTVVRPVCTNLQSNICSRTYIYNGLSSIAIIRILTHYGLEQLRAYVIRVI